MNKGEFLDSCRESLGRHEDLIARQQVLERLTDSYLQDSQLQARETTALLLSEAMKQDLILAEDIVEKFDRQTRPAFILPVAAACTVIAGGIIYATPLPGGETWLTILCLGMLYVCLLLLPSWRRSVPKLRKEVDNLAELTGQEVSQAWIERIVEARITIVTLLTKANYKSPFGVQTDELILLIGEVDRE